MASDTIHLQSRFKSLKVCIDGGKMDYSQAKGRTPRVEKQPTYIAFAAGQAKVEKESPRSPSAPWKDADWSDLGATSRSGAVAKIQALNGYGVDFAVVDSTVGNPVAGRAAAGAGV